ncbi:hypothetical protein FKM82_004783, partial [Ascaphus truei]
IWAAGAGAVHTLPSDLVWKAQQSWGTGDDMKVTLLDVDGEESADRAIYRIRRGEDESEEDLFEEAITESPFHSQVKPWMAPIPPMQLAYMDQKTCPCNFFNVIFAIFFGKLDQKKKKKMLFSFMMIS